MPSILVAVKMSSRMPQPWRSVVDWVVTIVLAVVFVLAFEAEVAKPYRIPSSSMEPTLHCAKPGAWCEGHYNDRVIANRLAFRFTSPKRGQIVVFKTPPAAAECGAGDGGTTFVKRLIGLPGDRVSERDGYVYINGKKLNEPYVDPTLRDSETSSWPRVAPNHYFFLGDDRMHSCDSRTWGTVPRSSLIGPVIATYWPPNRIDWFG
jgi:signal peptidase I